MTESSDIQAAGQHYLVCGTEDCKKNGQFYCNVCHRPMCEQCREDHLNSPDTKSHEIVLYRHRKHELPEEKCKLHPKRNVDIFCRECQFPVCSKCSTMKEHHTHTFEDLEEIYSEKYAILQCEFSKIQKYFLPTSQGLKEDIKKDAAEIKNIMENIRKAMKSQAESLKLLVDEVSSENIKHTHTIEESLLKMLKSQETMYDDYTTYLNKMTHKFQEYLSSTNITLLISATLKIKTIPEITKAVPPVFTAGQFNKEDVNKLLGRVHIPNKEPEKRRMKLFAHMEQTLEKSDIKQTLSLSTSVTKVREYTVPGVNEASHISVDKSGRLWVSDLHCHLVQTNLQNKLLRNIQHKGGYYQGYHTVTQSEDMIYTDTPKQVIYRITPDKKFTEFIKTGGNWYPMSIHSSRINGDILVGMTNDGRGKVTRYNETGKEIDNYKGHKLYSEPCYMTENFNGEICTSDYRKQAVVVVNKSGQHRFTYKGQESNPRFHPYGICTDVLGHILLCDFPKNTIHLLNQDGGFLSILLAEDLGIQPTIGVCG